MYWILLLGAATACYTAVDTTCASCVEQSNETSLCVWCYDDNECREWTTTMPCSNTSDLSFGGEQCECRPGVEQSCSTCVRKESCVWLEDSSIEVTAILDVGNNNKAIVTAFSLNTGSSCWAGDMFYGPTWTDWLLYGNHLTIHAHLHDAVWSWGQCNIPGVWMIMIIFMISFISAITFCYCAKLAIQRRKMRREVVDKDEPILYTEGPNGAVPYRQMTGADGEVRD